MTFCLTTGIIAFLIVTKEVTTMSFIFRQEIKGNIYLYEVTSYWDKEKKQSRQKRKYLGREKAGKKKKIEKNSKIIYQKHGDVFLLKQISKKTGLDNILKNAFPKHSNDILSLAFFSICDNSPFYMYPPWLDEHYIEKVRNLYSSDISGLCKLIGEREKSIYNFFEQWISKCHPKSGVYFDITSISSHATNFDFIEWGYNRDKEKLPQINMGLVCSEESELPLYYKIYPGSISDVSTLENCLKYLKAFKISDVILILDRGFCSKKNILKIKKLKQISFIQPMTYSMKQVSEIIKTNRRRIKKIDAAFKSNEEILYHVKTNFKIENEEFIAHIYYNEKTEVDQKQQLYSKLLDIEKSFVSKKFETKKEYVNYCDENIKKQYIDFFKYNKSSKSIVRNNRKITNYLLRSGYFIMLTNNKNLDKYTVLEHYRKRDIVEKMFDVEKNEMDSKRLRCHSKHNVNGRIFIKFVSLILHSYLTRIMRENKLFNKYSIKTLLAELSKIRYAKINGEKVNTEVSKKQRDILKYFDISPDMI